MTESDILRIWNGPTSVCNRAKILKFAADLEAKRAERPTNEKADEQALEFIYKLNAMEFAALSADPAKNGYAEKREAVLSYVAKLERECAAYDAIINDDGSLTTHAEKLSILQDMAHAYKHSSDWEAQEDTLRAAQAEIAVSYKLLAERNRVLAAIPECDAHGDQCVPHALEWITSVQAELEQERKAHKQTSRQANEAIETTNQHAADLQARLDRVEAVLKECRRIPVMPFPDPGAHSWEAFGRATFTAWSRIWQKIDALSAAGGQESAAAQGDKEALAYAQGCQDGIKVGIKRASAADPALPGLEILASHSGKSQNREWHSVGTWLYPGEAIYEGTPK